MTSGERSLSGWAVAGLVGVYLLGLAAAGFAFVLTAVGFMASDACASYDSCERWINLTVYALLPWAPLLAVGAGIVAVRARSPKDKLLAVASVPVGALLLSLINMAVINAVSARVTG